MYHGPILTVEEIEKDKSLTINSFKLYHSRQLQI